MAVSPKTAAPASHEDFVQWAFDTLILAFEINSTDEPSPARYRRNKSAAKRELQAIASALPAPEARYRDIYIRVVRRAAQIINDGETAQLAAEKGGARG